MYKHILLAGLVALAVAAPAPDPKPLALISDLKTPASTAKLTPLATPILSHIPAPIPQVAYAAPALAHVAPYGYAYSAPYLAAAAPSSYSITQHGYNIVY